MGLAVVECAVRGCAAMGQPAQPEVAWLMQRFRRVSVERLNALPCMSLNVDKSKRPILVTSPVFGRLRSSTAIARWRRGA